MEDYDFPVWGTQGGGLARRLGGALGYRFVFIEAPPKGMGLSVGDEVPGDWDIQPANSLARDELARLDEEAFLAGEGL